MTKKRHSDKGHFIIQDMKILVHIPPIYSTDISKCIDRYFYQILLKYDSRYNGVPLCYTNASILSNDSVIINDNPFLHITIKLKMLLFRPNIGQLIAGIVNRVSSNHIGLIVYGLFNAVIPTNIETDNPDLVGKRILFRITEIKRLHPFTIMGELVN
jgi:DNA-directed RNA polymerase I subunit RPA43